MLNILTETSRANICITVVVVREQSLILPKYKFLQLKS